MEEELVKALKTFGYQLTSLSEKFVSDYSPLTDKLAAVLQIAYSAQGIDVKPSTDSASLRVDHTRNASSGAQQGSQLQTPARPKSILENRSSSENKPLLQNRP
jgi:hypothetical protein